MLFQEHALPLRHDSIAVWIGKVPLSSNQVQTSDQQPKKIILLVWNNQPNHMHTMQESYKN
jgi:hypothetical protein